MRKSLLWGIPGLFYLAFCLWYTDLGGPLEPEEIAQFASEFEALGRSPEQVASVRRFMEEDTGRQFLMLNALELAANPTPPPGAAPDASAEDLMAHYMEHMFRELLRRACHPVVAGDAVHPAMDLVGIENGEDWSLGALMRYRSRRSLMEIITMPETLERHDFKIAALEKTIAYPVETRVYLGDLRVLLGLALLSGTALLDLATSRRR